MKLNVKWYRGAKDEAAKLERKQHVASSTHVLGVLRGVLEDELRALEAQQEAQVNYEKPAWTALQADYLATRRTLKGVIALLTFDQRED